MAIKSISSKDNPQYKLLKMLALDNTSYRSSGQVWLEGEHLCQAALDAGMRFTQLVLLDTVQDEKRVFWSSRCESLVHLNGSLMNALSALPSPSWIGAVVELPQHKALNPLTSAVVLDQVQDPGNVGAILRCAAAFGFEQIITTPGSVALWSAKVIRSAMGAHFGLQLNESMDVIDILKLNTPVLLTDVHQGMYVHQLVADKKSPWPCIWVFGHEGRGVSHDWPDGRVQRVRIAQPGGQESLNVATAAAICLHASASQRVEKC
jgi:TrmH family RNA methyltransferase